MAPAVPTAPSDLMATLTTRSTIDLTWTDNSTFEDGVDIERSLDGVLYDYLDSVGSNVVNYTDSGLSPATTYYYRARAYNANGSSLPSNEATAAPPMTGDANGDGILNNLDITAFGLALFDPTTYAAMYPNAEPDIALDMNGDGVFDILDSTDFGVALGF